MSTVHNSPPPAYDDGQLFSPPHTGLGYGAMLSGFDGVASQPYGTSEVITFHPQYVNQSGQGQGAMVEQCIAGSSSPRPLYNSPNTNMAPNFNGATHEDTGFVGNLRGDWNCDGVFATQQVVPTGWNNGTYVASEDVSGSSGRAGKKTLSRKEIEQRARNKEQEAIRRLERAVRPYLGDMKIRGRADLIHATVGVVEWLVMQHNSQGGV
jgi:hypothetical protein